MTKPLDAAERQLLEDIMTAVNDGDQAAFDGWGGVVKASSIFAELKDREAASSSESRGQIDTFETHLAERISADTSGA